MLQPASPPEPVHTQFAHHHARRCSEIHDSPAFPRAGRESGVWWTIEYLHCGINITGWRECSAGLPVISKGRDRDKRWHIRPAHQAVESSYIDIDNLL